jgi:uncharacterized protein (TIGR02246 family)
MNPTDIARDFAVRFADAWNRHDMDELASLFREDASFVNVVGVRMDGREEIRRTHAKVHDGPYRASRLVVEVEAAREIPPAVIVAELRTQISGMSGRRVRSETRASCWCWTIAGESGASPPVRTRSWRHPQVEPQRHSCIDCKVTLKA